MINNHLWLNTTALNSTEIAFISWSIHTIPFNPLNQLFGVLKRFSQISKDRRFWGALWFSQWYSHIFIYFNSSQDCWDNNFAAFLFCSIIWLKIYPSTISGIILRPPVDKNCAVALGMFRIRCVNLSNPSCLFFIPVGSQYNRLFIL